MTADGKSGLKFQIIGLNTDYEISVIACDNPDRIQSWAIRTADLAGSCRSSEIAPPDDHEFGNDDNNKLI